MSKLPNFSGKAFLAPMAGITDPAMRLLCKQMGAALVTTELTSIHGIVAQSSKKHLREFLQFSEKERPLSIQLFGSDIDALAKAAKITEPYFDLIDYNMGCPAPHITQQMAGGALLQEENLTRKILQTLVNAVDIPVTLKMRAGVTQASRKLYLNIAQIAQEEGIQMITLHPRTVSQGYSGMADWDLIAELKRTVNVPIIGNGDITSPEDAKAMMDRTKCDYVMIGRAAASNPFLFRQINEYLKTGRYCKLTKEEKKYALLQYMQYAKKYGIGLARIKTITMRFTRGVHNATKTRSLVSKAMTITDLEDIAKNS
ncbi:MAG: nitrogen fixation protein NifR [Cenarchaeum symbiont of Oopsacas minuta]|nr:nitrogen fixation protein NifR [Cenarchaeum symbiont of Oopsacas minuta]